MDIESLKTSKDGLTITDAKTLDLWFDAGIWDFNIKGSKDSQNTVDFIQDGPSSFSTEADTSKNSLDITQFVSGSGITTYRGPDNISFSAISSPYDEIDGVITAKATVLHVATDKGLYEINVSPSKLGMNDKVRNCISINTPAAFKDRKLDGEKYSGLIGVRVSIDRIETPPIVVDAETALRLEGKSGWLTLRGVTPDSLSQSSAAGNVDSFIVSENISSLSLDGVASPTQPTDFIDSFGDFRVDFAADGKLRFAGNAKVIRKNNIRMNGTRWENLSEGMQISLLGAICVVTLAVVGGFYNLMSRQQVLPIFSRFEH